MKPLKLTLQGFEGIYAAYGRDELVLDLQAIPEEATLVALVGPNGAGKSTVLENLHPYRCMPSRGTTLGPGGFSYWTQIRGTTAMKELLWENGDVRYRTVLSFKTTGKTQKSDCYLYQWNADALDWRPVHLHDGTVSDGKASTYDSCVDTILGPPEKFFTAHFAAQGRKTIDSYGNSDIKSILASVLNLQNFRALATKAGLVCRFLRQQLESVNGELADLRSQEQSATVLAEEVARVHTLISQATSEAESAQQSAHATREELARLHAKRDTQAKDIEQVKFLTAQIDLISDKAATTKANVTAQFSQDQLRYRTDVTTAQADIANAQRTMQYEEGELRRLESVLTEREVIVKAVAELSEWQQQLPEIDSAIESHQAIMDGAAEVRTKISALLAEQAKLGAEGKANMIRIQSLTSTASLVETVPCKGSEMQLSCPLMAQANSAKREAPEHEAAQVSKRQSYAAIGAKLKDCQAGIARFDSVESSLSSLQKERKRILDAIHTCNGFAAKAPLIADAELRLPKLAASLVVHRTVISNGTERLHTATEMLSSIESEKVQAMKDIDASRLADTKVFEQRLASLEKPISDHDLAVSKAAVSSADLLVAQSIARTRVLAEQKVTLMGKLEAVRLLATRAVDVRCQAERLHEEIAKWKLLEKGLGNDGCVALSIDDSGPEIAAICNSLLSDCFAGRFSVRLDTQNETKTGGMKETFDVKVFDGHRGSEKSLGDMSGGEKVLVNECVTRSVALYQAQSDLTSCDTLFTDETDGALDPETKRTFMFMKRAVVKQGGYSREYFITHTPELWQMADFQIMMAEL